MNASQLESRSAPKRATPTVCIVLAPFLPSTMPSLGASLLKSTLEQAGIATDVYYALFEFFECFAGEYRPDELFHMYELIATFSDTGETLFADALWGDQKAAITQRINATIEHGMLRSLDVRFRTRFSRFLRRFADSADVLLERCYAARDWDQYDIVGFSSTFSQNVASLALAKLVKQRHPQVLVVFGGANCEGDMGEQIVASFPHVDAVLRGEADQSFLEFVRRVRTGESLAEVAGVVYRDRGLVRRGPPTRPNTALDELPIPEFSDYFAQRPAALDRAGDAAEVRLPIETSRGCWWGAIKHCVFCGLNSNAMAFRSKSTARALHEFRTLAAAHGIRRFFAVDNIIGTEHLKELLPALESDGLDIFYETKANLNESQVAQLARAGVRQIQPGIESLSTRILRLMRKGVPAYRNLELLKWCRTHDVTPLWFFMFGFVGERAEDYYESIANFPRLWHLHPPKSANNVTLCRFSPYFDQREQFGFKNVRPASSSAEYYAGLSEAERFRLAYHFDHDIHEDCDLSVANGLFRAVWSWQQRHFAGAFFHKFVGDDVTLLVDGRDVEPSSYLLEGVGHRIHEFLHTAKSTTALRECFEALDDRPAPASDQDRRLLAHAAALGAHRWASPTSIEDLEAFLASLDKAELVLRIDDRWLALATARGAHHLSQLPRIDPFRQPSGESGHDPIRHHEDLEGDRDEQSNRHCDAVHRERHDLTDRQHQSVHDHDQQQ